jgi:hypothetical protein
MHKDITYQKAIQDHPEQVADVIRQIKTSRSKFSNTDPETWIWYYHFAAWGRYVQGSSREEMIEDFLHNSICSVRLAGSPNSRAAVRFSEVENEVVRDYAEKYVDDSFELIKRYQVHIDGS